MKNCNEELNKRVLFLQKVLRDSGCSGFVYGNSGGKDSTLVGILCKKACDNTLGVILPCNSSRNFGEDRDDALKTAKQYNIETVTIDLTSARTALLEEADKVSKVSDGALVNIAPRLRMTALYAIAQSRNSLVVGTGNRSEGYMGYFTKWGDGAYDVDPIADLTVTEIYDLLRYLNAPAHIIEKAPSAGLFEGQTDENEMGVTYREIDEYLQHGKVSPESAAKIERAHQRSEHKRTLPLTFNE